MPSVADVDTPLPTSVQEIIARRIAERLVRSFVATRPHRKASAASPASDAEVVLDGQRYIIRFKRTVTLSQMVESVRSALAELSGDGTQLLMLRDIDPELAPVIAAVIAQVPAAVRARRQALSEQHIDALAEIYMANDPLSAAFPDLESDNAQAQARVLERWPMLTAETLAQRARHGSNNKSATANRWKRAGKIFAVRTGGREVYPAFQFKDGQPRPVISQVLSRLPDAMSPWQTAFWFVGANSWLDGDAPADRLDDSHALIAAASHEGQAWMG